MNFRSNPRYNYDKSSKEEKKDIIEKLAPEKIDEFKEFLTNIDEQIKVEFGALGRTERIRFDKINNFVADMVDCKALAMVMYFSHYSSSMINFKKVLSNEKTGEDALTSLKIAFGDTLKLPWMRRMNLFDYPFDVQYKKEKESKCVNMTMEFRKSNIIAKYRLIIKGIGFQLKES
jgi:hypothetical protein